MTDRPPVDPSDLPSTQSGFGMQLLEGLSGLGTQSILNLSLGGTWVDLVLDAYLEILFSGDVKTANKIVNTYADAMRPVRPMMADFLDDLTKMGTVNPDDVFNGKKWQRLEAAMDEAIGAYSPKVQQLIAEGQMSSIAITNEALDKSWTAMALDTGDPAIIGRWHQMPERAYADMVGRLQDGSPLSELLDQLPAQTNLEMRRGLLRGIALGENSDVVGRRVARATDMPRYKAVAISRTAMFSTYRETTRRNYIDNSDLVDGWYWQSSQNERTCMSCLMRDGTLYPLDEPMASHTSCRCRMRPRLRNNENVLRETGRDWFERQSPETQMKMLGPKAHDAWKTGQIDLMDLAGFALDPKWGPVSNRRSVSEAVQFVKSGRPYHVRDYPPGWARPGDLDVLRSGADAAFARLDETKAYFQTINQPPIDITDFRVCMGH